MVCIGGQMVERSSVACFACGLPDGDGQERGTFSVECDEKGPLFGGWLRLFMVLMAFAPLGVTIQAIRGFETWQQVMAQAGGAWFWVTSIELIWAIVYAGLFYWLSYLFFAKKRIFPARYTQVITAGIVFNIFDFLLYSFVAGEFIPSVGFLVAGALHVLFPVACAVYFLRSRRVAATFISL